MATAVCSIYLVGKASTPIYSNVGSNLLIGIYTLVVHGQESSNGNTHTQVSCVN